METLKIGFGKTYLADKLPTHGVYRAQSIKQHGLNAVAVSHHWSKDAAILAAKKETKLKSEPCVAVQYQKAK